MVACKDVSIKVTCSGILCILIAQNFLEKLVVVVSMIWENNAIVALL